MRSDMHLPLSAALVHPEASRLTSCEMLLTWQRFVVSAAGPAHFSELLDFSTTWYHWHFSSVADPTRLRPPTAVVMTDLKSSERSRRTHVDVAGLLYCARAKVPAIRLAVERARRGRGEG